MLSDMAFWYCAQCRMEGPGFQSSHGGKKPAILCLHDGSLDDESTPTHKKGQVVCYHVYVIGAHKRTCVDHWNMLRPPYFDHWPYHTTILRPDLNLIIGMCNKANAETVSCFPRDMLNTAARSLTCYPGS